jgi:hypothetical protein
MNWTLSTIFYLYFTFVGACYLLGFWGPLNFNIMELLSPVDILKSATYPLIPTLLGVLFFASVDAINLSGVETAKNNRDYRNMEGMSRFDRLINNISIICGFLFIVCMSILIIFGVFRAGMFLYFAYMAEAEEKFMYLLPFISMVSLGLLVAKPPHFLKDKSRFVRSFILILICSMPNVAFFQGHLNISNMISAKSSFYYLKKSSTSCAVIKNVWQQYLGYYGGMYIFMNSNNKDICIEKVGGILLSYYEFKNQIPVKVIEMPISKKIESN